MSRNNNDKGIVYVLSNPVYQEPPLFKIGVTKEGGLKRRMRELYTSAVPCPFKCEYAILVDNSKKIEKALHFAFSTERFNGKREFFTTTPDRIIAILKLLGGEDITNTVNEDIDSNATAEDLRARARVTRRPNINFFRLGIFAGEKIHFLSNRESDENIYAEIIDSNTVKYNGDIYSLTALTKKLLQYSGNLRPAPHWAYKDKKLSELYDECYRNE